MEEQPTIKQIEKWNSNEVCTWVKNLLLINHNKKPEMVEEIVKKFSSFTGRSLLGVNKEGLVALDIPFGMAVEVWSALTTIREKETEKEKINSEATKDELKAWAMWS